jgi:uncharacterized protein YaaN involved in tellurite resistance
VSTTPEPAPTSAAAAAEAVLTPPEPVAAVAPEAADEKMPLTPERTAELDQVAGAYMARITSLDVASPEFAAATDELRAIGDQEMRESAQSSNRLLDTPVRAMQGDDGTAKVASTLTELRRTVEDLDPAQATGVKKLLGLIPFGDKLRDYFRKYESAQSHLDAIVKALYDGKDELLADNVALENERRNLWESMGRLREYAYITSALDGAVEAEIAKVQTTDPERAAKLRDEVLFYVRQKHTDLLTQLAVSIQGYLAIDLVKRNNVELIKGVDRATTTTLAALRTAVIVAQALTHQKLVLDQITALNTTTENMIAGTSKLLKEQGADIHAQASSSMIGIETLQAAFADVYAAMDAVDTYKAEALQSMAQTVSALETEVAGARKYLERSGTPER